MSDFNNQNQQRAPLPKTAFDEMKLRLSGPQQEGARRPPNLKVAVIRNNPRIDVFTNIEGDRDNGRISAPMEALTMFALITKVEDIAMGPPDVQVKIANKTGAPGQQKILSHTVVGKDKEGRVFISVIAQDRPRIKFLFLPSDWHEMAHKDGTPYDQAELSTVYARAWAKMMAELIPNVMDTHFQESDYQKNGGKSGGGGGYNKGGYNKGGQGGGYQKNNRGGGQPQSSGMDSGGPDFGDDAFPM